MNRQKNDQGRGYAASCATLVLSFCLFSPRLVALNENFELYLPPQVVAMGGAFTADAYGYLANYYNPAGLAKVPKKKWEYIPLALEGVFSSGAISASSSAMSFGAFRLINKMQLSPGSYSFLSGTVMPAISRRGFSLSLLGNYRYAAVSDGTNLQVDSVVDIGPVVGFAQNLASNFFKIGIAGKFFLRNQLKGTFAHTALSSEDAIRSLSNEGYGIGADVGLVFSPPMKYLPTLGIVWKDALGTRFLGTHLLNSLASGTPEIIEQKVNIGFSLHPALGKRVKSTFAVDFKNALHNEILITKRLNFGVQIETDRNFFIWFGTKSITLWSFGVALRLSGGNFELATYEEDIGDATTTVGDRRFMFRYTISF